jgi:homogentisate 1,2-dioxygenase
MPFYVKQGEIPRKRHITFYQPDGKTLYREELVSTRGFSGVSSNKYHTHLPTRIVQVRPKNPGPPEKLWIDAPLQPYHFDCTQVSSSGDFVFSRRTLLANAHCRIGVATVTQPSECFFRNAWGHELIFVHEGQGVLRSDYGDLKVSAGHYVVIPKATVYRLEFHGEARLWWVESGSLFDIPKHFRNEYGQLKEGAPYSERDFQTPVLNSPLNESGEFEVILKAGDRYLSYQVDRHPFDVVGWDGFVYPFTFHMEDYEPMVGKIHLPPPTHLVFSTQHFVFCNFVPRLFDFHPQAIPAPYYHSNVDSDEVLYYVKGNFMSRKGVRPGSMTLHPGGIPHGPQPGKQEESIGKLETQEYALMVDTFHPLNLTEWAKHCMDASYVESWLS